MLGSLCIVVRVRKLRFQILATRSCCSRGSYSHQIKLDFE